MALTICRSLRSEEDTKYIPILLLTARGAEVDKVLGLEMGADDYIVKTVWRKRSLRTCTRGTASYGKSSCAPARRKN